MANKYWEKRVAQLLKENIQATESLNAKTRKSMKETLLKIEKDIAYYIDKMAVEGNLSKTEVRKTLNREEMKALKMSLEEFYEINKEDVDKDTAKRLKPNIYALDRLEAMKLEAKKHIEVLYYKLEEDIVYFLGKTFLDSYYKTIYDTIQYRGFFDFDVINYRKLDKIINTPWLPDGSNFSDFIWKDKTKLLNELEKSLVDMASKGTPVKEVSKNLAERMDVARSRAETLIRTENAYFSNEAMSEAFQEGTAKEYEIVATLDLRTSSICRSMDGKVFKYSEKVIGVNHPHFHPNCRTTIVPHFGDDIEKALGTTRMARDPLTGKSVRVDRMTYPEWYEKYVASNHDALQAEKNLRKKKRKK